MAEASSPSASPPPVHRMSSSGGSVSASASAGIASGSGGGVSIGGSISEIIARIDKNDPTVTQFVDAKLLKFSSQIQALALALKKNTYVKNVELERCAMTTEDAKVFAEAIKENNTINTLDLGYNNIQADGIILLSEAIAVNKSLKIVKIHRQTNPYGKAAEEAVARIWETNTTLERLYATLHDRRCNQTNTRGEVRNKEIARRIEAGKDWADLDPKRRHEVHEQKERERQQEKMKEEQALAPIIEKVPSTGGPYTLKQLTCKKEYIADDVDLIKKESYLSDEEFQQLFLVDKEGFYKYPAWKQLKLKTSLNLH